MRRLLQFEPTKALSILSVVIAFLWIVIDTAIDPTAFDAGRGGAVGTIITFWTALLQNSFSSSALPFSTTIAASDHTKAQIMRGVDTTATEHRIKSLECRLDALPYEIVNLENKNKLLAKRHNLRLIVANAICTLFWGFGDVIGKAIFLIPSLLEIAKCRILAH